MGLSSLDLQVRGDIVPRSNEFSIASRPANADGDADADANSRHKPSLPAVGAFVEHRPHPPLRFGGFPLGPGQPRAAGPSAPRTQSGHCFARPPWRFGWMPNRSSNTAMRWDLRHHGLQHRVIRARRLRANARQNLDHNGKTNTNFFPPSPPRLVDRVIRDEAIPKWQDMEEKVMIVAVYAVTK